MLFLFSKYLYFFGHVKAVIVYWLSLECAVKPNMRQMFPQTNIRKLAQTHNDPKPPHLRCPVAWWRADWHRRDPVAPCGNRRQAAMKDVGRLFPVIVILGLAVGVGIEWKQSKQSTHVYTSKSKSLLISTILQETHSSGIASL